MSPKSLRQNLKNEQEQMKNDDSLNKVVGRLSNMTNRLLSPLEYRHNTTPKAIINIKPVKTITTPPVKTPVKATPQKPNPRRQPI